MKTFTNVLVTGGLGFIGSHICVELLKMKTNLGLHIFNVIVIDNLENSKYEVIQKIEQTVQNEININVRNRFHVNIFDLLNKEKINAFFDNNKIDIIIHCAGKKAVGESVQYPLLYYRENINITLNLLENVEKHQIQQFIFSSSATVYGNSSNNDYSNLTESSEIGNNISNPYGKTKYFQEEILRDFYKVNSELKCYILRYFNPIGCHQEGLIGENPAGLPNNLMPYIIRVAANNNTNNIFQEESYQQLTIFGNDYDTQDGTCLRDYIHVCDLAQAHIDVLWSNDEDNNVKIFNVGTGNGTSVLEIVNAFKSQNENVTELKYIIGKRREGDEPITVCDNTKIIENTLWRPKYDINDMVKHSWNFIKVNYL